MLTLITCLALVLGITLALPQSSGAESSGLLRIGKTIKSHATFYSGNTDGACGADYTVPEGFIGTAVSSALWTDSAACGSCYRVTYGTITKLVFVSDLCPECNWNSQGGDGASLHQDLFSSSWKTLAAGKDTPSSAGILRGLSWTAISCGLDSVRIHWKDGSNDQWTALAPRNHNVPVTKLEVRLADSSTGSWLTLKRDEASAHFVSPEGDLPGKEFDVRLTGSTGNVITLTNVRRGDNTQTFSTNF